MALYVYVEDYYYTLESSNKICNASSLMLSHK